MALHDDGEVSTHTTNDTDVQQCSNTIFTSVAKQRLRLMHRKPALQAARGHVPQGMHSIFKIRLCFMSFSDYVQITRMSFFLASLRIAVHSKAIRLGTSTNLQKHSKSLLQTQAMGVHPLTSASMTARKPPTSSALLQHPLIMRVEALGGSILRPSSRA